jgi:hypothetical protein
MVPALPLEELEEPLNECRLAETAGLQTETYWQGLTASA